MKKKSAVGHGVNDVKDKHECVASSHTNEKCWYTIGDETDCIHIEVLLSLGITPTMPDISLKDKKED